MGGPRSAQAAGLHMAAEQTLNTMRSLFSRHFISARYSDNFHLFGPEMSLASCFNNLQPLLSKAYDMPI